MLLVFCSQVLLFLPERWCRGFGGLALVHDASVLLQRFANSFWSSCTLPSKQNQKEKENGKVVYKDKQTKWTDRSRPGVFAGYEMKPGYEWTGRYLVWDLDAFQGANLFATTKKCMKSHNDPPRCQEAGAAGGRDQVPSEACIH